MSENKIIVDEDWKAQVEAEKAAAKAPEKPTESAAEAKRSEEFPPATLSSLIMSLTAQAWMTLGQIPNPETGKGEVYLPMARHVIDTLEMLEQKTKGNRTPEEISLLSRTLHELRMAYVAVEQEVGKR
jgi:hypothetical protein